MRFPYVLDVRQYGGIIGAAGRRQDAGDTAGMFMLMSFACHAVDRFKSVSEGKACQSGCFASDDDVALFLETSTFFQGKPGGKVLFRPVAEYFLFHADDAEAAVIIPEGEGVNGGGFSRLPQFLYLRIRNISDRLVFQKNRVQDELVGGAFGAGKDRERFYGVVDSVI